MLDAISPAFPCEKCAGTGMYSKWDKCFACKGRGRFSTSPEARAKAKARREARSRAGNQQSNHDKSIYLTVMNRKRGEPLFLQMRADHEAGRCWTTGQVHAARSMIAAEFEAKQRETERKSHERHDEPAVCW